MLKRFSLLMICLLMFAHVVSAQTAEPDTFPVEQRCVGAPTQPPSDWTYPGMILMSGYAGIHAMQADWDTPHVVAQLTMDDQGNVPIDGGQLSPDQNWYAVPIGDVIIEPSLNQIYEVRGLRAYSLSGDGQMIALDLSDYDNAVNDYTAWIYAPVVWQDTQSLVIGALLIDPLDETIGDFQSHSFGYAPNPTVISPDLTRGYVGIRLGLYDLANSTRLADFGNLKYISWRRDSSGFIAEIQGNGQSNQRTLLIYFDRNGDPVDQVFDLDGNLSAPVHPVSRRSELQWSLDDRHFGFVENFFPESDRSKLFLVDMQERVVIDTCLPAINAPVWSPDGSMFAYLTNAPQNLNLVVVDTITWKAYIVARHSGMYTRFGDPEMVGWRSTT